MPAARRLLLVSHRPLTYEGPGTVRWRYLIEHLPEHGWEVSVLSARPNPTQDELSADPRSARLASARARAMGAVGRALRPAANVAGVQPEAFAPSLLWGLTARRAIRARVEVVRPDAVVATSPPVAALFAVGGALSRWSVPLVADLRDPWAGHPTYDAGGGLLRRLEGAALAPFDAVVGVTPGMVERLALLHPGLGDRLHVTPNGFDPLLLERRAERRPASARTTLIHPGVLYGDRGLDALLAAIARTSRAPQLRLELVGNLTPAAGRSLRRAPPALEVDVAGPRTWAETMERVARADIVVVIVPASMGDDVAWPVKLFEALALGRPVLAITSGGATETLLEELGLGAGCARDGDVPSIVAALERLLTRPPAPVDPGRLAQWDRAAVTRRYARLLDEVLAARSPRTARSSRA